MTSDGFGAGCNRKCRVVIGHLEVPIESTQINALDTPPTQYKIDDERVPKNCWRVPIESENAQ